MAEPILWAHRLHGDKASPNALKPVARRWNEDTGQVEDVIDPETGIPVREKVPARGHNGDEDVRTARMLNIPRWVHVLRHDGHETRVPITMAAADLDGSDNYGKKIRAKARFFGWIPVGRCPIALLTAGELSPSKLACRDLQKVSTPCKHGTYGDLRPCPHYVLERDARVHRNNVLQGRIAKQHQSEADKLLKGQEAQTSAIVEQLAKGNERFAEQLAALVAAALKLPPPDAPSPSPTPPAPAPEAKKR